MKPRITVKFYPPLKDLLNVSSVIISASNAAEALEKLSKIYGAKFSDEVMNPDGSVKSYYILFLDGHIIDQKNPSATKLKSGDTLDIFPPVAGG